MPDRIDTCYRCGRRTQGSRLCPTCEVEVQNRANARPSEQTCSCGYTFVNDWERQKHVELGLHHYRAHQPEPVADLKLGT